jgi:hypothetical protein
LTPCTLTDEHIRPLTSSTEKLEEMNAAETQVRRAAAQAGVDGVAAASDQNTSCRGPLAFEVQWDV